MVEPPERASTSGTEQCAPWRLNILRVGYLFVGVGLAVTKWPLLPDVRNSELKEGTVDVMLVALSFLALLGLRYPVRMLPVLLFEVTWKLIWLAAAGLPLWSGNKLEGVAAEQAGVILWVVIVMAVIPWRYVVAQYATATGDPWRRPKVHSLVAPSVEVSTPLVAEPGFGLRLDV